MDAAAIAAAAAAAPPAAANLTPAQFAEPIQHLGHQGGTKKVTPFTTGAASNWTIWRRNFITIALINGWPDERQRREISAAMEGEAARSIGDVDFAAIADRDALLDAYEERFLPLAAGIIARAELKTARQIPQENVLQWHTRLREIFI